MRQRQLVRRLWKKPVCGAVLWLGLLGVGTLTASQASTLGLLLKLPGDRVEVHYSPGSLDRAAHVQKRFDLLVRDFRKLADAEEALVIFLLSREEWEQESFLVPYGVPQTLAGRGLALSAWGDPGTVELWSQLLGSRPPVLSGQPLRGTPEQAASLAVADVIAAVEAARLLLRSAGYGGESPWIDGVMAHAVALGFLHKHEPARRLEVAHVFASLSMRGGGAGARPLAAAASPESLQERLWFEAQFFAAANLVDEVERGQAAKSLLKRARRAGGQIRAADLISRYPRLERWLLSSFSER